MTTTAESRTCARCGQTLPVAMFGFHSVRGVRYRESECKPCKAERMREFRRRKKDEQEGFLALIQAALAEDWDSEEDTIYDDDE